MGAPRPIVVIGAGGHGREALAIIRAVNRAANMFELLGVLNDDPDGAALLDRIGTTRLGPPELLCDLDATYVIAIGDPATRKRVAEQLGVTRQAPAILIHPHASVGDDVTLGPGCMLQAGSRVTTYATLGHHVHLNSNATVAHDTALDDYSTLSPGSNLAGTVHLGEGVMIGTNAAVIPGITIGPWTVVGAGAVVTHDLPGGITAVGIPARVMGPPPHH